MFIFNSQLVHGKLVAAWAVAGLKPSVRRLTAGKLPAGAIIGRNGSGQARYSLCPPRGSTANYVILVDPLPRHVPVSPGFDPNAVSNDVVGIANVEGKLGFSYKRA